MDVHDILFWKSTSYFSNRYFLKLCDKEVHRQLDKNIR